MALRLVIVYLIAVAIGAAVSYLVGLVVDRYDSSLGMLAFLGVLFVTLWAGWIFAVRVTDPARASRRA